MLLLSYLCYVTRYLVWAVSFLLTYVTYLLSYRYLRFLFLSRILYFSLLSSVFTCLFPYTPAYTCSMYRTYCHAAIYAYVPFYLQLASNPLLFFLLTICYLSLSSLLTYMSYLLYPGPSYVRTVLHTCCYASYELLSSYSLLTILYFSLLSTYSAYLLAYVHVFLFVPPAIPCPTLVPYCHTVISFCTLVPIYTYLQSFTFLTYLLYVPI
jgi:hypothetical protein